MKGLEIENVKLRREYQKVLTDLHRAKIENNELKAEIETLKAKTTKTKAK